MSFDGDFKAHMTTLCSII